MTSTADPNTRLAAAPEESPEGRRVMKLFLATGLSVAVLLMVDGLIMRMAQAGWLAIDPGFFYSLLTLHGAGMITSLVLCGMGGVWYLTRKEVPMSMSLAYWAYGLVVAGIVLVAVAALVGRFAATWTFLFPLPFVNPTWPNWATGTFLIAMVLIVLGWTVWCIQILEAVLRRFGGFRGALGWDLVFHPKAFKESGKAPPSPQMLAALVTSFNGLFAATAATLLAVPLLVHWIDPAVAIDALWAKNATYFFGHQFANLIIYMLVALVYVGLPRYANRPWKTSNVLVLGWWGTMTFILLNYSHHLYMDFVQPGPLQLLGVLASYLSSIPVAVVTVYGGMMLVWRSGIRWALGSIFMYAGLTGWILGGIGALLDAAIPFNVVFHNTLWVTAHFHGYLLGASLLFAMGWVFLRLEERSSSPTNTATRWLVSGTVLGGIALFLASFYASGAAGVPRRYAVNPEPGPILAGWGSVGAILFFVGLLLALAEGLRLRQARNSRATVAIQPGAEGERA